MPGTPGTLGMPRTPCEALHYDPGREWTRRARAFFFSTVLVFAGRGPGGGNYPGE